jgi:serpin B
MRIRSIFPILATLMFTACSDSAEPATPDAEGGAGGHGSASQAPGDATESAQPTASNAASATPTPTAKTTPRPVDAASAKLAKTFASSSNAFGYDFWRTLAPSSKGNVAVSPASLSIALSMAYGGAVGDTATEMAKVLHVTGTPASDVTNGAGALDSQLTDGSRAVKIEIANKLFGERTYAFEDPFLDATKKAYGAGLEPVDFKKHPDAARGTINAWVEAQTNKRITNLIPPGAIKPDTRLVLTNAIYFLGDWAHPFEQRMTYDAPFSTTKTERANVATMHQVGSFGFVAKDGVKVVSMPYAGGATSMLVVLPDAVDGVGALESSLDPKKVDAWIAAMKPTDLQLAMPKFEIDPPEPIEAGAMLQTLGIRTAFTEHADFTEIAHPSNPAERLKISEVFHKAFVKVDEKGTEAAAATAIVDVEAGAADVPHGVAVDVDHPFLFLMRDDATGAILFMGRVANPSAK